jgi:hypothetical protein
MDKLLELLSHFDIVLFLSAIILFVIAMIGKIGIPKILPPMDLKVWQRVIFGVLSFILLCFALLPLLPTRITFVRKVLGDYESDILALPDAGSSKKHELPEVPAGKKALLLVTARAFSSHEQPQSGTPTPTLHIVLKLDDNDIGSSRSSWYYYRGTTNLNPTISTSCVLTPGRHMLQIVVEQKHDVQIKGTQLRYQLLELD